jgi:hypothetical protein
LDHKGVFLRLPSHHQGTIRLLLSLIAVLNIVDFAAAGRINLGPTLAIVGNLVVVYWFALPRQALPWFFTLIPYLCAITGIFDGLTVTRAVREGELQSSSAILSIARLAILVLVLPAVLRYQREVSIARRDAVT